MTHTNRESIDSGSPGKRKESCDAPSNPDLDFSDVHIPGAVEESHSETRPNPNQPDGLSEVKPLSTDISSKESSLDSPDAAETWANNGPAHQAEECHHDNHSSKSEPTSPDSLSLFSLDDVNKNGTRQNQEGEKQNRNANLLASRHSKNGKPMNRGSDPSHHTDNSQEEKENRRHTGTAHSGDTNTNSRNSTGPFSNSPASSSSQNQNTQAHPFKDRNNSKASDSNQAQANPRPQHSQQGPRSPIEIFAAPILLLGQGISSLLIKFLHFIKALIRGIGRVIEALATLLILVYLVDILTLLTAPQAAYPTLSETASLSARIVGIGTASLHFIPLIWGMFFIAILIDMVFNNGDRFDTDRPLKRV